MTDTKIPSETQELHPPSLGAIRDMFEEFNVPDVSDEICTRVLDVLYRHTCDIVEESRAIANHSGHTMIEEGDMKLAIESTSDSLMFAPPHKEQLLAYAEKNSQPLPPVRAMNGIRLPTDRHNLTAPNYALKQSDSDADKQRISTENPTAMLAAPPGTGAQSVFRLSAAGHSVNPLGQSAVRVIAPPGVGPSVLRIQSVQSMAQLPAVDSSGSAVRAVPIGSVASNLAPVQRRFVDG